MILKLLKIIIPLLVLYIIYSINHVVGIAIVAVILLGLLCFYRYLIYYIRGSKLYDLGELTEAAKFFKKAANIRTCSDTIRHFYAFILLKDKQLDEAQAVLDKMSKKKLKQNVKCSVKMSSALVQWKKGNLNEAVQILEEVYKEYKNTTLYENLGYLLVLEKNYDRALIINKEAYEYNGSSKTICDNLGETYYHMGEYDKAYEIYEQLVNNEPKFMEPYYHYGLVLAKLGRKEEALNNFNKALEFKENYLSEVTHEDVNMAIKSIDLQG